MAEKKNVGFLKFVLAVFAVVSMVYGICYFFVPDFLVKLSGEVPVYHGWLRWSGGSLIALGIGSILVFNKPKYQGIFVNILALGCLLNAIALVWAWIGAVEGTNTWFTILPAIITLVLAVLLFWSGQLAKDILYPKGE